MMNVLELLYAFQESRATVSVYVDNLPLWVQYWMKFMMVVLVPAFIFSYKHAAARVIGVALIYSQILTQFMLMAVGPSLLWGLSHILFWLPACIYIGLSYASINWKSVYGVWLAIATITMMISLLFDIRDLILFLL